jgi:hypothetical protein
VIEIGLLADAGEDVGQRAPLGTREERLVGRDQRHSGRAGKRHQPLEHLFLLARILALHLDEAARAPEERDQLIQDPAGAVVITGGEPQRQRAARATSETHQPRGARLEVFQGE